MAQQSPEKKRRGRPPLPAGEGRTHRFRIKASEAEVAAIHRQAAMRGLTGADYIRAGSVAGWPKRIDIHQELELLRYGLMSAIERCEKRGDQTGAAEARENLEVLASIVQRL